MRVGQQRSWRQAQVNAALLAACAAGCFTVAAGGQEPRRVTGGAAAPAANVDARHYLGAADSSGYSTLDQITRANVQQLALAWSYNAGPTRGRFQPLVVDGVMYVLGRENAIIALDARTGAVRWTYEHDPEDRRDITDRGLNYWESRDRADRRLLFSAGNNLRAIDARTGKAIPAFGDKGRVDLRQGLDRDPDSVMQIGFNSPGRIFEDLLIIGGRPGEAYTSPPGYIRAYNVVTGALAWTFYTIPRPGEFGSDTWPKDVHEYIGATNVWGDTSLDEARGIVYLPTGSPVYDFYGSNRRGTNLFGNCLLALDARTGKRLWHYQTVHHDLWDYDNTSAPQLITVTHGGKKVDAVALAGKTGFLYVFDRVTGAPLWPIEERPVPPSDVPGEEAWPTQPVPTMPAPFAKQQFTERDISPFLSAAERAAVAKTLRESRNEGLFTPPSIRGTVTMPGTNGGANWGSAAADPAQGKVYVISIEGPSILRLEQQPPPTGWQSGSPEQIGRRLYTQRCAACHGPNREGQPTMNPPIPALVDVTARLQPADIKRVVLLGRNGMPAVSLDNHDLNAVISFLANPAAGAPDWPTAPPAAGAAAGHQASAADVERPTPASKKGEVRYWSAYNNLPGFAPPSSTLTAYDLNTGLISWQVPLGDNPQLLAKGFTGTGAGAKGAVVTASGLIFIATYDKTLRAFDKETGELVWSKALPVVPGGVATTYMLDGRQYIAIHGAGPRPEGGGPGAAAAVSTAPPADGSYLVFALPAGAASKTGGSATSK